MELTPSNVTQILSSNRRAYRHINFIGLRDTVSCVQPSEYYLEPEKSCEYVATTPDCMEIVQIFDYLNYLVCYLHVNRTYIGNVKLILFSLAWIALYVFIFIILTHYFLIPNVIALFNVRLMNGFDYGYTIISLTICVPKIFDLLLSCAFQHQHGSLIVSQSIAQMLTAYSTGMMILAFYTTKKFHPLRFTRNNIILVAGGIYLVEIIYFKMLREYDVYQKNADPSTIPNLQIHGAVMFILYIAYILYLLISSKLVINREIKEANRLKTQQPEEISKHEVPTGRIRVVRPFKLFIYTLNPFRHLKSWPMWLQIIAIPIWIPLALSLPVHSTDRPINGWCKPIACTSYIVLSLIIFPLGPTLIFKFVFLGVGIFISLLTVFITKSREAPKFHAFYSVTSILVGFFLFSMIDNELNVLLWQVMSYQFDWKYDTICILAFHWGQTIASIIFCHALIIWDQINMAYGVVYGVPSFSIYTTLIVISWNYCFKRSDLLLITAHTYTAFYFFLISAAFTYFGILLANFHIRVSHGVFNLVMFALFTLYVGLGIAGIIHPYGTQHGIALFIYGSKSQWA